MTHPIRIAAVCGMLAIVPATAVAGSGASATEGAIDRQGTSAAAERSVQSYELAALRRATAHLHRFENALAAGWNLQVTDCKVNPPVGGMGYHFGHEGFYLDGVANVLEPEVLLYEPLPDGRMRLVGVEYIVPLFAWQGEGTPRLFGRDMKWVEEFQEWQLHVWAWKHNPAGIFEDWNPEVTCAHAP